MTKTWAVAPSTRLARGKVRLSIVEGRVRCKHLVRMCK